MTPVEDEKPIIQACLDHAPFAWEQFVDRYSPVVLGAVESIKSDAAAENQSLDVDEAVAMVFRFLRADDCKQLRRFDFHSSFHTYLIVVTHQTVL